MHKMYWAEGTEEGGLGKPVLFALIGRERDEQLILSCMHVVAVHDAE